MSITKKFYGNTPEGEEVNLFTLTNENGMTAEIINYGGILVSLKTPDKNGNFEDIVLGYENLEGYLNDIAFLGATIGRNSNRIKNANFTLNGVRYDVTKNSGEHQLHGGFKGFYRVVWQANIVDNIGVEALELTYFSKDGEEGFPGNVTAKVTYTLTGDNELKIDYRAVSDKDTVVNMTNHSYFNLAGASSGNILTHKLLLNADKLTAIDKDVIPTGEIFDVKGTPMDFTTLTTVGSRIAEDYEQLKLAGGYDHNWILNVSGKAPEKAAELFEESTGRLMEVYTTKPGIQFYSGNFLDGSRVGKGGKVYSKNTGLCLETQYFPNALECANFPSPILKKDEQYKHTTIFKFTTR